jgi:methanesulfonate monooxygenase small subunit
MTDHKSMRGRVEDLVYQLALLLDEGDFRAYLDLCEPDFRYLIGAYSPEIRKEMLWLDHDKPGLEVLFETLPRHNSDHARLSRHVTVYKVEAGSPGPDGGTAAAVSALQVFRTTLDGGATELFAVGKIFDQIRFTTGVARLVERKIKLETRMLGIGTHIPF